MDITVDSKKIMDKSPIIIFVADPFQDKIIYHNDEFDNLLGQNHNKVSSIFNASAEFEDYKNSFNKDSKKITFGHMINGRWIIVNISPVEIENNILMAIYGTDVTGLFYEGYFNPGKTKDSLTGIYDRQSGINYFDSFLDGLKNGARPPFTISYIELSADDGLSDSCLKDLTSIINTAIRGTDIFSFVEDHSFLVIFPECTFEIVENIMTTIENKIEILNSTSDVIQKISINYAILEIHRDNTATRHTLLSRAKFMLI